MSFYDKGETLLQRLNFFLIIIIVSLTSCVSSINTPDVISRKVDPLDYFEGTSINDWLRGIEAVESSISSNSFIRVYEIYLNEKFEVIRGNLELILSQYINSHDINFDSMLNLLNSQSDIDLLVRLARNLDSDKKYSFCKKVFSYESELRRPLLESVGQNLLVYSFIEPLYKDASSVEKSGIIYAAGFLKGEDVLSWLETFLYNNEYEISSSAVFSLSRHNSDGFKILTNNLNKLDSRLKIVTIDLLIFNKYEPLYSEFPNMLKVEDRVISDRIISSLRNMGNSGIPIILECLKVALPQYSINLLRILNNVEDKSFLSKIYYLIYNEDLRDSVIDLFYNNSGTSLIQRAITLESRTIANRFIDYGFKINSPYIFNNRVTQSNSLRYFLENFTQSEVSLYFDSINLDSQYIEDYINLEEIFQALVFMDNFEDSNGEIEFITKYFDISQKEFVAEQDNDAFFNGMELWLESGDITSLNKSMEIKNAGNGDFSAVDNEKREFLNSLSSENKSQINKYEEYKKSIISYYRTTSYRLKFLAEELIKDYGFSYLLN